MLRLVANLRRSVSGGHHLHLCQYYNSAKIVFHGKNNNIPALPLWHHHVQHSQPRTPSIRKNFQKVPLAMLSLQLGGLRGLATGTTSATSGKPPSGFIAWYLLMLNKYPLPTKSVTAANILAFADMTAQYLANMTLKEGESKQDWDKMRTLRMLGIGAFFSAPILHMWFNLMQRILPNTDITSSIKKVLAGQIVASPVVNSAFFAVNSFLQGESVDQAIEKIKRDLWPTWKSGAMYWPPLDFVTFRYVPIHLQVFFNNCCSFIWTIYLTSMAGKKAEAPSTGKLALHKPY